MASCKPEPEQLAFKFVEPDDCSEDEAPILLLHGKDASKEQWGDVPEIIAKATKRKVYALDFRNHGDSPKRSMWSLKSDVDDLLGFMDSISAWKAVVVGYEMGGVTAWRLALKAPERVEKLIVEDISYQKLPQPVINLGLRYLSAVEEALERIPADADEETARKIIFEGVSQCLPQSLKMFVKENANVLIQLKKDPGCRWTINYNTANLTNALKNANAIMEEPIAVYKAPACFIYGKYSPFLIGVDQDFIRTFFPNVKMVGIDNWTESDTRRKYSPSEFTNALLEFLQAQESPISCAKLMQEMRL